MSDDVARRVAVHAALAEPTRLRLVDLLMLGDLTPGELGRRVAVSSNLLAHHLRVLDDAGVVQRVRSEGDGRRSYVRLVLDDPFVARLVPGPPTELGPVTRVVFVCTQNSARSPLAAAAFEQVSDVPAASAGTRPAAQVHPRAAAVAARHQLDLSRRAASHVADVLRQGDLVVSVCDAVHEELVTSAAPPRAGGAAPGALPLPQIHWSVPDPVRVGTEQAFEAALIQITARVDRLGRAVTSSLEDRS